jgi:cell division control protein 6
MVDTSILGKRTRTIDSPAASSISAKRRVVLNEPNNENENPFITRESSATPKSAKTRSTRTTPAKHGAPEKRVALCPPKISAHFRPTKASADAIHNGKDEPSTPRHRDSKKVPVTPRHRVIIGSALRLGTPTTPRTPSTPFAGVSVYNQARQLFSRCANPGRLVGRDEERRQLSSFVENSIKSNSGGCLYVSGPPGTGKSALLDEVCKQHRESGDVSMSVVNCMSVRNTKDLSGKLSDDLELQEDAGFEYLRSCFVGDKARDDTKYLVILDEVDCLVDLDLSLLYSLFEWSMSPASRLILIGIANALDLTDRFLPRLKSKNLKPELLPFMPYAAAQIAEVLTSKLKSLMPEGSATVPFLQPAAIQFCAKKVASQTGDLRKAFDICQRAVDMVEQETKDKDAKASIPESPSKTPLMENTNLSTPVSSRSPTKSPFKTTNIAYTIETAPKATIAHMAKITAQVFNNGTTQRLWSLNLQQKAVLCSLAALEKKKRDNQIERYIMATPSKVNRTAPSIKQLFEAYSGLCQRGNLFAALSNMEFRDVVSGLETLSLVSAVDGKMGSFAPVTPSRTPSRKGKGGFGGAVRGDDRRVASAVGMKELHAALEGPGGDLLREMLEGNGLIA